MSDLGEGVARLESTLAGTRMNAERAVRELHEAMSRDLRRAERRADRAERRVEALRTRLRRARRRAERAEQALGRAEPPRASGAARGLARKVVRAVRGVGRR